jgi:3-hydroxyisobutyrate dehydrogenase-like beta-hydroxyacid dehydrogenase
LYNRAAPASFALRLARKDLGLATAAGYDAGASLPLVATALETFTMALGAHGDEDVALIAAFVDEMSQRPDGLPTVSAPC